MATNCPGSEQSDDRTLLARSTIVVVLRSEESAEQEILQRRETPQAAGTLVLRDEVWSKL